MTTDDKPMDTQSGAATETSATTTSTTISQTAPDASGTPKKPSAFLDSAVLNNPASAGVITMLITSTLGQQLHVPANWTAIVVSLVIAGWVWGDITLHWSRRFVSHLTNAFVIFMIANGVNASSLAAFQEFNADLEQPIERWHEQERHWLDHWNW